MSGFLFDTCVVRNWYAKNTAVETLVKALPGPDLLYISSITLGEIECAHLSPKATDKTKQADFRKWMRETFEVPALEINGSTALEYAKFRRQFFATFLRKGKHLEQFEDCLGAKLGIDENDLWLVSQAYERGLKFITNDGMAKIKSLDAENRIIVWPVT